MNITMIPCQSSQISAFGYDPESCTLAVKFNAGAVYHYHYVPPEVFAAFKTAESKGDYFGKNIRRGPYTYEKQPDAESGIAFGLTLEQESKYTTARNTGRLVNRDTGKPIPDDEPVFVIRAQDIHAVSALRWYRSVVSEPDQVAAVDKRIEAFRKFSDAHPSRMKEPDAITLEA